MKRTIFGVTALLLLLALALSPAIPGLQAAQPAQDATATPAPEQEHEHKATPEAEEEHAAHQGHSDAEADAEADTEAEMEMDGEPTMADLLARVEELEDTVHELYAAHEMAHAATYDQVNGVNTAIYLLDGAGLHQLEERLVNHGEIEAGDSGRVAQLSRMLSTVPWPDALAEEVEALQAMLDDLAEALGEDDLETVQPISTEAHVAYHVFSHNAQMWLAEAAEHHLADAPGQANRVNTAIYLIDGASLHGIDVQLNEEGEIQPGDAGRMAQVARLLTTVDWPDALAEDATALHETLMALSQALADDDLEAAAPLASQAHEEQHDFSHHAQGWLTEHDDSHGEHSEGEHSEHSEDGEGEGEDSESPAEHSHGG